MAGGESDSVRLLLDVALSERDIRLDSLDAMDGKAGVLVGFAGVLVGLTFVVPQVWMRALVMVPTLACAVWALVALRVGKVPAFDLQALRDKYLLEPEEITSRVLLDTLVSGQTAIETALTMKATRVAWSMRFLAIAILMMAVAVLASGPTT